MADIHFDVLNKLLVLSRWSQAGNLTQSLKQKQEGIGHCGREAQELMEKPGAGWALWSSSRHEQEHSRTEGPEKTPKHPAPARIPALIPILKSAGWETASFQAACISSPATSLGGLGRLNFLGWPLQTEKMLREYWCVCVGGEKIQNSLGQ